MENRDLQVRTFLNANGTPFYPKTRWSAIIDAPDVEATINNILVEGNYVSDANYVHTDNNFTNILKSKLEDLQTETIPLYAVYNNNTLTWEQTNPDFSTVWIAINTQHKYCYLLVNWFVENYDTVLEFQLKEWGFDHKKYILFSHIENFAGQDVLEEIVIKFNENNTCEITFDTFEQTQSDWEEKNSSRPSFLKNMPGVFRDPYENIETVQTNEIPDGTIIEKVVQDVDGNWYDGVVINNKIWMKQNLRVTHNPDGSDFYGSEYPQYGFKYPNNNSELIDTYGLLYAYRTVVGGITEGQEESSVGLQGIAPNGWSIPTASQYEDLLNYIGTKEEYIQNNNSTYIAKAVCSKETWNNSAVSYSPGNNQTTNNATNMSFVASGIYQNFPTNPVATGLGTTTMLATSYYANNNIKLLLLLNNAPSVQIYTVALSNHTYTFFSVRCVCNTPADEFLSNNRTYLKLTPNGMVWKQVSEVAETGDYNDLTNKPTIPTVPTVRTMNGEQLTDSSLGDINIHDGFYFPNAIQDADGNWYGAVVIGNQVWMGENFKCTSFPNGTPIINGSPSANGGVLNFSNVEARCYITDDDSSTIDEFGLEYNSRAIFNESSPSSLNPSGVQGIAPQGWHIPSYAEYDQLLNYVVSQKRYISEPPYNEQYPEANQYQTNSLCCSSNEIDGDQDKINATGFNWKLAPSQDDDFAFHSTLLATTDVDVIEPDLSIAMSGCACYGIYISTHEGSNINNPPDLTCGLHVRLISNLTPIQFRNWYVSTYGTMQHCLLPEDTSDNIQYGTTSYWNSRIGYIPPAGTIIVYSDYATKTVNNETVYIPNIKIGSGNGYVQDLEFIGEKEAADLLAHTSNTNIHVTANDKTNWNSKLNVDDNNEVSNETLIFIRN